MAPPPAPATSGRLTSRPGGPTHASLPPGLHALAEPGLPDHLVLVPERLRTPAPLLVFFHGAGGHASRSVAAVERAAADSGVVVLLPTSAAPTWDLLVGRLGPDVTALDRALQHVLDRAEVGRVAFGGFSDGASYALSLGLANGDLATSLLAFSPGFIAPPDQVGRPRVWLTHGRADTVLPVDRCGRQVVRQLGDAGYEVEYEEFAGGHVVPPEKVLSAFRWWLGDEPHG